MIYLVIMYVLVIDSVCMRMLRRDLVFFKDLLKLLFGSVSLTSCLVFELHYTLL